MNDPQEIARRFASSDYPSLKPSRSVRASEACATIGTVLSCAGMLLLVAVLWWGVL